MTLADWNQQLGLPDLEKQYNLPSGLLSSVLSAESAGNPNAVSGAGAQGLFQFEPATAKQYGIDPFDPQQAAQGAAQMYGDLSKKYNGDVPSMLAAYNWGQGNVDRKGLENAPDETKNYIAKVSAGLNPVAPEMIAELSPQPDQPSNGILSTIGNAIVSPASAADVPQNQPKEVTDPALIAQLEGAPSTEVTDPKILAQLEGQPEPIGIGKTAVDQAVQGATFGFGDEAEAGLAAAALSAMNGKSFSDNYKAAHDYTQKQLAAEVQQNPGTSIASNLAGGLASGIAGAGTKAGAAVASYLGSGGTAARIGKGVLAGTTSGALYGAGTADSGQRLAGAEQGGTFGAVTGGTIPALSSALGGLKSAIGLPSVSDALKPLAQKALDFGIPLSRSQISDSPFARSLSSVTKNIPLSGSPGFAAKQQTAFNKAVSNTIGQDAEKITPDVINKAYSDIGDKYDSLQNGQKITVDPSHINTLADIEDQASQWLTGDHSKVVSNTVSKVLNDIAPDGTIAGEKLGSLRSQLNSVLKGTKNDSSPYLAQIRNLTMDMTTGSDPAKQAILQQANQQYKNLKILEPLAAKAQASGGDISPALLRGAVSRGYNIARGQGGDLGDLANIGQAFLKDKTPDSGTAQRLMAYETLTAGPGELLTATTGNPLPILSPLFGITAGRAFNTLNHAQAGVKRAVQGTPSSALMSMANNKFIPSALAGYTGKQGNP